MCLSCPVIAENIPYEPKPFYDSDKRPTMYPQTREMTTGDTSGSLGHGTVTDYNEVLSVRITNYGEAEALKDGVTDEETMVLALNHTLQWNVRKIASLTGVHRSTVGRILKKYKGPGD